MFPFVARLAVAFAMNLLVAGTGHAAAATVTIDEVFSNFDGSVQFILLNRLGDPTASLAGRSLVASDGISAHRYTFAVDVPANKLSPNILVATQGFADLAVLQPDYVVPDGFVYLSNGSLTLEDTVFAYAAGQLPADGLRALYRDPHSGINTAYVAAAGNARGDTYSFVRNPKVAGLWWNRAEPGSGLVMEQQADSVFAAWATHDVDGSPIWFLIPRAGFHPPDVASDIFSFGWDGSMYRTTGPAFATGRFDSALVAATNVGGGEFDFDGEGERNGTFYFTINGVDGQKAFTLAVFGDPVPLCFAGVATGPTRNYQGLWWKPSEPGWALYLSHQGDVIFALWLTYDAAGKATWLSFTAPRITPDGYSGTVYRTTGPAYNAAPDASAVKNTAVGMASLAFTDRNSGSFTYAVNGVSQTKGIIREVFANPPTACE